MGFIGTTIRIPSVIPSWPKVSTELQAGKGQGSGFLEPIGIQFGVMNFGVLGLQGVAFGV